MKVSMNNTYYGYVEEIIKDEDGKPTLQLRVRVPSIHGYKDQSNIKLEDLPNSRTYYYSRNFIK